MTIMIEFCQANFSTCSDQVMAKLQSDSVLLDDLGEIEAIEYGCLGNCGQCYIQPFAMVEGSIVAGDTPEELLEEIKAQVKRKQEEDRAWRDLGF
ncbi:YuzB family protein [Ammoniphilus sp. YIM 78166]|uniref:YuzB family protein n=1 Tax=Ammoniphilus sp. YIM 78166 TaxID=1644106 RepID=UPI00106F7C2B|nr:YuzB family protein [Ammoniphilus sp. YIM 78166]